MKDEIKIALLFIAAIMLALAVSAMAGACTDESGARRALESQGFTSITFTGYRWMSCGRDDDFATGFIATNPTGKRVDGVVCCGLMKGCTVRF